MFVFLLLTLVSCLPYKVVQSDEDIVNKLVKDIPLITYSDFLSDVLSPVKPGDEVKLPSVGKLIEASKDPNLDHDLVTLISYPRSGNTLVRVYLDTIMGVYTGSGGSPTDPLI